MSEIARAAVLALACAASSLAAANPPQIEAGRKLAVAQCATCHGQDGNAPDAQFPRLAGQLQPFLELQLRNYRSGERPHPVMAGVAKGLKDRDIAAVSAYYASLAPMRHGGALDAQLVARGEQIYRVGKPGAPACQWCHGERGEGTAPVFARLAGQHPEFVVEALKPYRVVPRFGNPYANVMKAVVQEWSDEDLAAVAAYVASLNR
ncbi:c-type cytochrome [Caldimonas sp. KR1-144]|uniref:c-type cytochrome n=1 Tax=Caldimonas sp. KR1-144 TaxID=3400911 RepID=UPI003C08CB72